MQMVRAYRAQRKWWFARIAILRTADGATSWERNIRKIIIHYDIKSLKKLDLID